MAEYLLEKWWKGVETLISSLATAVRDPAPQGNQLALTPKKEMIQVDSRYSEY